MIKDNNKFVMKNIIKCFINIFIYALIILMLSNVLNTIDIDKSYYGMYAIISAIIIYILNKTIKPILFRLTIPITGITLGLFYPCINVLILKITDFILGNNFETHGIISLFFTAILISLINKIIEDLLLKNNLKG